MSDLHEVLHPAALKPWAAAQPDVSTCVEGDQHD